MMAFPRLPQICNAMSCLYKQTTPLGSKLLQSVNLINKQGLKTCLPWFPNKKTVPAKIPEPTEEDEKIEMDIYKEINNQLLTQNHSRLFAIILVAGKQFKVTDNDLIIIENYWPPNSGDKLKFEKVLLVGGTDFTIIGRPIVNPELANVSATVIEKTFSHTKYHFYHKPRKQYRRLKFLRVQHSIVRINSINLHAPINEKKEIEGLDRIY